MKNLIICHINYLVNKTTIIIFFLFFVITIINNIVGINSINKISYHECNYNYFLNSYFITKILGLFLTIFLFSYSFLTKQDQYSHLIISSSVSRGKYLVSKIISICIILLIFLIVEMFIYVIVGYLGYSNFLLFNDFCLSFLYLFMLMIYYGLITLLMTKILDNIFVVIIPFAIINIGMVMNQENNKTVFLNLYNIFFPTYIDDGYTSSTNINYILIMLIILLCINLIIFESIDIK